MRGWPFGVTVMFTAGWAMWLAAPIGATRAEDPPRVVRVEADGRGFHWAYYHYVPAAVRRQPGETVRSLLVVPNNTGSPDDDIHVHDAAARRGVERGRAWADRLGVILLQPVFPRSKKEWRVYTQALDRDTLLCETPQLRRLDRQLLAMIDHARERLAKEGVRTDSRVLVFGFSASGMFANRFTFLHPDRVKAAAVGSPGGWPLAPAARAEGKTLRYPVGVADLAEVAGAPLDTKALARVPLFFFMGADDTNDSVVFRDSFDEEDERLIGERFGTSPVARWPAAERLYRAVLPQATFKLYPQTGHRISPAMQSDVLDFFQKVLSP
jgi:dienelactone hydrolase